MLEGRVENSRGGMEGGRSWIDLGFGVWSLGFWCTSPGRYLSSTAACEQGDSKQHDLNIIKGVQTFLPFSFPPTLSMIPIHP